MGQLTNTTAEVQTLLDQEDIRSWGEYQQTDDQIIPIGGFTKVTCDGGEKDQTIPSSAVKVWDTSTSQGTFASGGFYSVLIALTLTATVNNTSVTLRLINTVDPLDFLDIDVFIERTGVPLSYDGKFELISTGSSFEIECNPENQVTINDIRVVPKREV